MSNSWAGIVIESFESKPVKQISIDVVLEMVGNLVFKPYIQERQHMINMYRVVDQWGVSSLCHTSEILYIQVVTLYINGKVHF